MHKIREREFKDSGSNANTKKYFEVRALLYVPAFIQKDFHNVHTGPPTKGTSTEEFAITNLEYTTPLSNTTTSTQERQGTKQKLNHLYTRGIKVQIQT